MTQTAENQLQDRLKVVRKRFLNLLDDRVDELEILRDHIDQQERRQEVLQKTQFIAHKISGTAGTLGFVEIGKLAAQTEETIIQFLSGKKIHPTFESTKQVIDCFIENTAEISSREYWQSFYTKH